MEKQRHFSRFIGQSGEELAIRAELVTDVRRAWANDANGTPIKTKFFIIGTPADTYTVSGTMDEIVKELETCLNEVEEWETE